MTKLDMTLVRNTIAASREATERTRDLCAQGRATLRSTASDLDKVLAKNVVATRLQLDASRGAQG